jgi:3-oxoacyl-[acyl-carrier protein] reductase
MELGLKGKNVLITGSTNGIGKATAEILAAEGANVVVSGRDKARAEMLAEELRKQYGVKAAGIPADLSCDGAAEQLFADATEALGDLDILVNSAGVWPTAYVTEMEKDEFEKTIYLNLEVPYILSRHMANQLIGRGQRGKIVNVVSQAAFHGSTTGHAHYAAAKAGLVTFMISQAREVAKHGININAVAPGIVRTKMIGDKLEKNPDYYLNRIPVGRVAEPEEIAQVIAFLASEKADYLTGITVDATGGMLMR